MAGISKRIEKGQAFSIRSHLLSLIGWKSIACHGNWVTMSQRTENSDTKGRAYATFSLFNYRFYCSVEAIQPTQKASTNL